MSVFALALMLGAAAPAAQDPALEKDARCVVALQKMIDTPDLAANKDGKAAVTGIMLFYLGRMSTRIAPAQIESAIDGAAAAWSTSDYKAPALQCIEEMRQLSGVANQG